MKSLFGGGAVFATALITASVLFYAHPLAAEPAFQDPTQQVKKQPPAVIEVTGMPGSVELPALQYAAADMSLKLEDIDALPSMAPSIAKAGGKDAAPLKDATELIAAAPQSYVATAYNLSGRTASGRPVSKGIIAADPGVLPLGTRVRLEAGPYSGEYLVADTGGGVRGRKIDVWVPSTHEACRFGRRSVKLTVLAYGGKRKARVRR